MASAELVELEYYLDVIQALCRYAYGRKSERDPFKIAEYKRSLKVLPGLERFLKNKIAWYDAASEVARWEKKLSSPVIHSGPPVRVGARQLSWQQYTEEGLQSAQGYRALLEINIFPFERKFPRWRETLDEILKKLAVAPAQMGNRVSRSTASQKKKRNRKPNRKPTRPQVKQSAFGSPPVNNAASEAESVIEVAQPVEPASPRNLFPQAKAPRFTHSGDYRKLGLDDATYMITPDQAAIFSCLAQAYERGLAGVPRKTLLVEVGSPTSRVRNFFQREGRKLYRDLIAYDKHARLYRLQRKPILSRTN